MVKTYPIPSQTYDELVCTAGVLEDGSFIRLYPINFRDLPYEQQYRKYQWIQLKVKAHGQKDVRKESYRPHPDSIQPLGEPLPPGGPGWPQRRSYALARCSASMEHLRDQQECDRTSLGVFKPKDVRDLVWTPDEAEWKPAFVGALKQARLWENRKASLQPPRKVPFKFQYRFACDDPRCNGHQMMNEDWELGRFYWRMVDQGATAEEACKRVREKFLNELCGPTKDTHFFVGTVSNHPKSWVVIGVFWPEIPVPPKQHLGTLPLPFDD